MWAKKATLIHSSITIYLLCFFWGATEIKDFVEEADFIQVSAGQSLETPFMLKTAADLIQKITGSNRLLPN